MLLHVSEYRLTADICTCEICKDTTGHDLSVKASHVLLRAGSVSTLEALANDEMLD